MNPEITPRLPNSSYDPRVVSSGVLFAGYLYMADSLSRAPEFTPRAFYGQLSAVLGFSLRELEVSAGPEQDIETMQTYLVTEVDPVGRNVAVDSFGINEHRAQELENPFTDSEIVHLIWRFRGDRRRTKGLNKLQQYLPG